MSDVDETLSEIGNAAVKYINMGFAVIPLKVRSKDPATPHGLRDWSDNPQTARECWSAHPQCNVGIVCGQVSHGIIVIDIDIDEDKDKDGYATLREWEKINGALPETVTAITGGGGMHMLYRVNREIRPFTNVEAGIDVRGDGSYIVAPPSVHPSGHVYTWENDPDEYEVADADANVYALIDSLRRNGGDSDDPTAATSKAPKFELPDKIREGERNDMLYRYACQQRAFGRNDDDIFNQTYGVNCSRCEPPLSIEDVRKIVRSACRHEQGTSNDDREIGKPGSKADSAEPWRGARGIILHHVLAQTMMENDRACRINGAPAIWTGARWDMGVDAIERAMYRYCQDIKQQTRNEVFRYIILNAPTLNVSSDFDSTPYVQFANVTLNALNGEEVTPTPEMLITNTLATPYDFDSADESIWSFLLSVSNNDLETLMLMLEVAGACMCSQRVTSEAVMMIGRAACADGEASNGKSTYITALKSMLGVHNVSSLDLGMLTKPFQRGMIIGMLANIGDDIPNTFLTGDAISTFKQMVTGDDVFTDIKGTKGFSFTPLASLIFSMNEMPRVGDTTEGMFRRLAFLPFRRTFKPGIPEFDPHIAKKITTPDARKRFAALAFGRLPELAERGYFRKLDDMAEEMRQVKLDNNIVLRWIDDAGIKVDDLHGKTTSEVFGIFEIWAAASGENHGYENGSIRKSTFVKRVVKAFGGEIKSEAREHGGVSMKTFVCSG